MAKEHTRTVGADVYWAMYRAVEPVFEATCRAVFRPDIDTLGLSVDAAIDRDVSTEPPGAETVWAVSEILGC